jgi:hypothetical protein
VVPLVVVGSATTNVGSPPRMGADSSAKTSRLLTRSEDFCFMMSTLPSLGSIQLGLKSEHPESNSVESNTGIVYWLPVYPVQHLVFTRCLYW